MNEWVPDSLPGKDNNTVAPSGHIHFATVSTTPTVFPALSSFLIEAAFLYPTFSTEVPVCSMCFYLWHDTPGLRCSWGKEKKSLLLKIIQKLLDKRSFQIPSSSNNQWTHASQPCRGTSMKYKTCVFNFPSSPPLNAFLFLLVNPRRSRPCEPIKRTVLSHLPPWASQQSQLHPPFLIMRAIPILSGRICEDSCWASQTFGGGETWGKLLHSSTPFY